MKHHRHPGRPPLDAADPSVPVTVAIPARQLAALHERAKRYRITVPEAIRRACRQSTAAELKRKK